MASKELSARALCCSIAVAAVGLGQHCVSNAMEEAPEYKRYMWSCEAAVLLASHNSLYGHHYSDAYCRAGSGNSIYLLDGSGQYAKLCSEVERRKTELNLGSKADEVLERGRTLGACKTAPVQTKGSSSTRPVSDAVFLAGASRAFDTLFNKGQMGLKQNIHACYAKLSFDSQASAVALCFANDLTAAWIDDGISKEIGAQPDSDLLESQSLARGANALRAVGVETETEVAGTLRAWKDKTRPAFRKAAARGALQMQGKSK